MHGSWVSPGGEYDAVGIRGPGRPVGAGACWDVGCRGGPAVISDWTGRRSSRTLSVAMVNPGDVLLLSVRPCRYKVLTRTAMLPSRHGADGLWMHIPHVLPLAGVGGVPTQEAGKAGAAQGAGAAPEPQRQVRAIPGWWCDVVPTVESNRK